MAYSFNKGLVFIQEFLSFYGNHAVFTALIMFRHSYLLYQKNLVYNVTFYMVIHKSPRDFRPLQYSSRDGHTEGVHVDRGRDTPVFCPTLQVLDMSTLAPWQLTQFWQIPRHRTLSYSLSTPCFVMTAPLAVKPASTPRSLVHKKTWRHSLPIDMLLSAVSVLVVAQSSSEFPEGLMNYSVFLKVQF
jgi:hypothetical protein